MQTMTTPSSVDRIASPNESSARQKAELGQERPMRMSPPLIDADGPDQLEPPSTVRKISPWPSPARHVSVPGMHASS
jgi:hypothetical protein